MPQAPQIVPVFQNRLLAPLVFKAVPICFAPLQRSTRRSTARDTSPSGRGWSTRALVRSMPALVTRTLPWPQSLVDRGHILYKRAGRPDAEEADHRHRPC
jgi:hypothetical protein